MMLIDFETFDGGLSCWGVDSIEAAQANVETAHGPMIWGPIDADGLNDDDEQCYRMLCWDTEADSVGDPGAASYGQLSWVGELR